MSDISDLHYEIEPLLLTSKIGDHWRSNNIIWLDMQIDKIDNNSLKFYFDVAFNPLSQRRGNMNRRDYYIGCTGAEIQVEFEDSTILDHTKASTINVDYKNSETLKRSCKLVFHPKSKTVDLGEISFDKSTEYTFESSFSCEERTLAPVSHKNGVKWEIAQPKKSSIVRDYLIGNLYLNVVVRSDDLNSNSGKIRVKTSDVLCFGPDKTCLTGRKLLLMQIYLKYHGIKIYNEDGFVINFKKIS